MSIARQLDTSDTVGRIIGLESDGELQTQPTREQLEKC